VKKQKMETKFVVGIALFVLAALIGSAAAGTAVPGVPYVMDKPASTDYGYTVSDAGTATPGVPVIDIPMINGDAAKYGLDGYDHFAAYAGSPFISSYMY
jgi:hypothetical protein